MKDLVSFIVRTNVQYVGMDVDGINVSIDFHAIDPDEWEEHIGSYTVSAATRLDMRHHRSSCISSYNHKICIYLLMPCFYPPSPVPLSCVLCAQEFVQAIRSGDLPIVQRLLKSGIASPNKGGYRMHE